MASSPNPLSQLSEASSPPPSSPSSSSPPPANATPPSANEPPRAPPSPPSTPSPPSHGDPPPPPPKDSPPSSPPPVTPPPAEQSTPPPSNPPSPPSFSPPSSSPPPSSSSPPSSPPPPTPAPPPREPPPPPIESSPPSPPGPPSSSPPGDPPLSSPPSHSPPSKSPPSETPPTASPPSKSPPSEAPPTASPPSKSPPSETPPTASPPSKSPPSETPPSKSPPSKSPPSKSPPSELPPTASPPSKSPPSEAPPTASPPSEAHPTVSPPQKSPPPSESPPSLLQPPVSPPSLEPPTTPTPPPQSEKVTPIVPSSPNSTSGTTINDHTDGSGKDGGISGGAIAGISIAVTLSLISVALFLCFVRKKRRKDGGSYPDGSYAPFTMPAPVHSTHMSDSSYPKSPAAPLVKISSEGQGSPGDLGNMKWFPLEELSEVTHGFSRENLLGEGGFGCVYKGVLHDGREVAVKQLKIGGGQGEREFQAEVEIISRIHHRHLVSLVGYCMAHNQRLLVYEYISNNTLHHHLHGSGTSVLDWSNRVKVAVGAAKGIAYLHEDCHQRIIHRDIKSSNILLDDSFEARVSDFGLAKLTLDAQTHVTTRVMGTFGYLAPEYASSGKLTDRSDVFSFGVVLLELITGRKPVDQSQPMGDESLVEWARQLMTNAIETKEIDMLADPRLEGNYVKLEMLHMIEAAAACVRHSAAKRPTMGKVARALEHLSSSVDLANGMIPGQSEMFSSGVNSENARIFQMMAFGEQPFSSGFSQEGWNGSLHEDV